MSQPQAVIFDIGNVLTRWQPEAFYDRVIGEDRRRALFAEALGGVRRPWSVENESGRIVIGRQLEAAE